MTVNGDTAAHERPATSDDVRRLVDGLVDRHVLTRDQADAVTAAFAQSAAQPPTPAAPAPSAPAAPPAPSARGRSAEVAGYLGGALVAGAACLFLLTSWAELGTATRVATLASLAAVLLVAGAVLGSGVPLRAGGDPARRRLVSTLWVLAAWSAAGAARVVLGGAHPALADVAFCAVLVLGSAAAYALAPSLLGQFSCWGGAVGLFVSVVGLSDGEHRVLLASGLVAVGLLWAALGLRGVLHEREAALAAAVVTALIGAQLPLADDVRALAYLLTAAVAAACFGGYLRVHSGSLLAGGVVATTLVVPEAAEGLLGDSLPVTLVLLLAGITLLTASALGLRLRPRDGDQESQDAGSVREREPSG